MRTALVARRIAAYVLDVVLLALVLVPLAFGIQAVSGYTVSNGLGVWIATVAIISVPSWAYFIVSDRSVRGATLGKRLLGLRVETSSGGRPSWGRGLLRTAVKLLPWELVHLSAFALAPRLGETDTLQLIGFGVAYALLFGYLAVTVLTGGQRGPHDVIARTRVVRAA